MNRIILCLIFLIALYIPGCGSSTSGYGLSLISTYEGATLYRTVTPSGAGNIKVISLSGSFGDMGRQYGQLLKDDLNQFYQDIVLDYLVGEKGIAYDEFVAVSEESYDSAMDETKEFIQGAAETSGLSLTQLQTINTSMVAAIFGCSAVAAWGEHTGDGPLVLGRNWDMTPLDRFKDYMMVVVYNPPTENSVADINYLGQVQHMQSAMNDHGLWIDLQDASMMSSDSDSSNQDPNKAILQFLMNSSSMEDLDAAFMADPSSASVIMTTADPDVSYSYFWCTQGTYRFTEDDQSGLLATSNNYVTYPDTWTINPLPDDPAAQAYTEIRRNNWLTLANSSSYYGKLDEETMMSMLETTIPEGGGTFPTSGYDVETVYQIVASPETLTIWIRLPKYYEWEKIELGPLFN